MAAQCALAFAMTLAHVNLSSAFVLPVATPRQSMARTPRQGLPHTSLRTLRVSETAEDLKPDSQTLSEVRPYSCVAETDSRVQAVAVCRGLRLPAVAH